MNDVVNSFDGKVPSSSRNQLRRILHNNNNNNNNNNIIHPNITYNNIYIQLNIFKNIG